MLGKLPNLAEPFFLLINKTEIISISIKLLYKSMINKERIRAWRWDINHNETFNILVKAWLGKIITTYNNESS